MDRNPKAYQVLAVGSCQKEIKTKLCINEPLMKKRLPYLPGARNFHGIASKPSHNIHTLRNLKGFSLSSLGISSTKDVWLLRK